MKYGIEAKKYVVVNYRHLTLIQAISLAALGFAIYQSYFLSLSVYIGIGVLVVLTALYAIPVLPHTKNLRSLGGLKIFVVALVWAGSTVVLPVLAADVSISWDVQMETVQRFLLVLILLVPFEIRDLAYDSPELHTLPQRFGVKGTKIIAACAIAPFFLLTLLKDAAHPAELWVNAVLCLLLGVLILSTRISRNRYFASFWVEAVPILWWALLFLSES
ncbi:hypothetical protein RQM65_13140 [Pricia sp. S334]|uniref:Prenyltransferase n=1 Tax=Pricia mediterranea TaxID=3076079 RepID=A0ABU3L7D9_9FLAO|nr:hypothetical protein [Pricia sp. S334]MDT7829612.1 hypothetical protein [Pricia sp. S334]